MILLLLATQVIIVTVVRENIPNRYICANINSFISDVNDFINWRCGRCSDRNKKKY